MDRKQLPGVTGKKRPSSKRKTVYLRALTTGLIDGDLCPGEAASQRWFQLIAVSRAGSMGRRNAGSEFARRSRKI